MKSHPKYKKNLFFGFTLLFPILIFIALEIGLRFLNYGPNLELFTREVVAGRTLFVMNPDAANRYFPNTEFSVNTSVDYFQVPKPAATYRIFCLGGSTTVGFPYGYIGSFSTFLRDRLKAIFPSKQIEVINLGLTATNSYTVVDIAREVVNYEPDLIIVYDGHNEFYGAFGTASNESLGNVRWVVKVYLSLIHLKTLLLVRDAISAVTGMVQEPETPQNRTTLMEQLAKGQYVEYKSDSYNTAFEIFQANVEEVKILCSKNNIPLLLSTQVSNLRNLSPFVSVHQTNLSPEKLAAFESAYMRATALKDSGQFERAIDYYRKASTIDSQFAQSYYYAGQCYDTLGNMKEALQAYNKARDMDQLRFRMSGDFNEFLRKEHSEHIVDIEKYFQDNSADGIVGNDLILEHLHPNIRGYFLMAKAYCRSMRNRQLLAPEEEWDRADTVSDATLWQDKSITPFDELCARIRIDMLTSSWPFTHRLKREQQTTEKIASVAEEVVHAHKTWEQGHVAAAEIFQQEGELKRAEAEYRALVNQLPYNVSAYLRLAQVLVQQKRHYDARSVLEQSLHVEKTAYAFQTLSGIALQAQETTDAIHLLEQAYAIAPSTSERLKIGHSLAVVYAKNGKIDFAREKAAELLSIDPGFTPAQTLLQNLQPRK